MNINNLFNCLKKEIELLLSMEDVSLEKQKALLTSNIDSLELCMKREENLLLNLQAEEENRRILIKKLLNKNNELTLDESKQKMSELFKGKFETKMIDELLTLENKMKNHLFSIKKINEHNVFLINCSQQFLKEVVTILINNPLKAIIDRKI